MPAPGFHKCPEKDRLFAPGWVNNGVVKDDVHSTEKK